MDRILKILEASIKEGKAVVLVTVVLAEGSTPREAGAKMLVFDDGAIEGTVGGGKVEKLAIETALEVLKTGKPRKERFELTEKGIGMTCSGTNEMFFEPFASAPKILLLGAGHVNQKVSALAEFLGFKVEVADDREDYANKNNFPGAQNIFVMPAHQAIKANTDSNTFLVIATRGHALDKECLEEALKTNARYIGMMGSLSKVPGTFEAVKQAGFNPGEDRVYSPIGLDIGGKSPADIAFSIMSQILMVYNKKSGRVLAIKPQ